MIEKPEGKYSIKKLSRQEGISRIKLTYGFRDMFGISIHRFIINTRMEKAKELLHTTNLPVKAIAVQCGYKSTQHFITAFKKYSGQPPALYKKNN